MASARLLGLAALCALCAIAPQYAEAQDLAPGQFSYRLDSTGYYYNGCRSHFLSPVDDEVTDVNYNPRNVDWKGFLNAIDCLGKREHRVCTFIIRMFFHDAGAVDTGKTPYQAADASVIINDKEAILPQSTQHGEAPMDRYILTRLAAKYHMSYADALAIAAAQCTLTFKSPLNIWKYASSQKLPMKVGKLDNNDVTIDAVKDPLPGGVDPADKWLKFWRVYLNSKISQPKWQFSVKEAVALMGSHILLDNHMCSRGASGDRRHNHWDNGYYTDTMSGRVIVKTSPSATGYLIQMNGFSKADGSPCDFETSGFNRKTHNAEHEAKAYQLQNNIFVDDSTFNPQKLDVYWSPDASRAVCYDDDLCNPCRGAFDPRQFCYNGGDRHADGDAFWPYTINDGFLAYAARNPTLYCSTAFNGCNFGGDWSYSTRDQDLIAIQRAFSLFRNSQTAWLRAYATGSSKLSNMGARYSAATGGKGVNFVSLVGSHVGQCDYDWNPVNRGLVDDILGVPPCDVPDPKDIPGAAPPDPNDCFPGDALVMTPSGETKRMEHVRVGDFVAAVKADGSITYEMVYAQGHDDANAVSDFVRLTLAPTTDATSDSKTLELTSGHFLPVQYGSGRRHLRAKDVDVGDHVWAVQHGLQTTLYTVTSKSMVKKQGLYNPYTTSGSILVNSVEASCHSDWILDSFFDALDAAHLLPAVYQALLSPMRWGLRIVGRDLYLNLRAHELVMAVVTRITIMDALAAVAAVATFKVAARFRMKA